MGKWGIFLYVSFLWNLKTHAHTKVLKLLILLLISLVIHPELDCILRILSTTTNNNAMGDDEESSRRGENFHFKDFYSRRTNAKGQRRKSNWSVWVSRTFLFYEKERKFEKFAEGLMTEKALRIIFLKKIHVSFPHPKKCLLIVA